MNSGSLPHVPPMPCNSIPKPHIMFLKSWTSGCVFKYILIQNSFFLWALAIDPSLCYLNVVSKAIKSSLNFNEIFHSVIFFENVLTAKVLNLTLMFL